MKCHVIILKEFMEQYLMIHKHIRNTLLSEKNVTKQYNPVFVKTIYIFTYVSMYLENRRVYVYACV